MADTQPTTATEQDVYQKVVNDIAEKNAVIVEKNAAIATLTQTETVLSERVKQLKADADQLERENAKKLADTNALTEKSKADVEKTRSSVGDEISKLDAEKASIEKNRKVIANEKAEAEKVKAETARINSENIAIQAEIDSKNIESIRLSQRRADELAAIKFETATSIDATKKLEVLRASIELESAENNATLLKIHEARKGSETLMNQITEERNKNEAIRIAAINENSSLDYKQGIVSNLVNVFKQALHSYVQIAGTDVKIPELTAKDAQMVIETLQEEFNLIPTQPESTPEIVPEVTVPAKTPEIEPETFDLGTDLVETTLNETPETTPADVAETETTETAEEDTNTSPVGESEDEVADIVSLRTQYTEKFGKSPFNGWNAAQLLEKINQPAE